MMPDSKEYNGAARAEKKSQVASCKRLGFLLLRRGPEAETRSSGASIECKWGDSPARAFRGPGEKEKYGKKGTY